MARPTVQKTPASQYSIRSPLEDLLICCGSFLLLYTITSQDKTFYTNDYKDRYKIWLTH